MSCVNTGDGTGKSREFRHDPAKTRPCLVLCSASIADEALPHIVRVRLTSFCLGSVFIENHDNPRSVSRYVSDATQESRELGAKLLATMQTTLSGTLYVYQGEEIGMGNVPLSWSPEEYKDIESINYWKKMTDLYKDDEKMLRFAKEVLQKKARDHARTPVQWSDGANAGFCEDGIEPWYFAPTRIPFS